MSKFHTPMFGTPSLVRDDRIKVKKRCPGVLCLGENVARAGRVFSIGGGEKGERLHGVKFCCFDLMKI